jgi:hypothetical protein
MAHDPGQSHDRVEPATRGRVPHRYGAAHLGPIPGESHPYLCFVINPKTKKKIITPTKKAPLERGIRPQPDICRDEWVQVGMALKPEVKRLERGTS